MSPDSARAFALPISVHLGRQVRDERIRRGWTLRELAGRAGLSVAGVHWIEAGNPGSLGTYAALARALRLRPSFDLLDTRRLPTPRPEDPVHAAMGDVIVRHVVGPSVRASLDEPWQHYQFSGRADVVAWSLERRTLLHVENRTRFPNLQETFGSYNAKRQWLARAIAERTGLREGFDSVTHVIAALWSSEVLHTLRLRAASFRAVCPDTAEAFARWWSGDDPLPGVHSCLVVLDPGVRGRARPWIDLTAALTTKPRYAGYAAAVAALGLAR